MQMTDQEIVRRFKNGTEKPTKQIAILAELNACSKKTIRDILEANGCSVPKTGNRYTVKKALENAATAGEEVGINTQNVGIMSECPEAVIKICKERMQIISGYLLDLKKQTADYTKEYYQLKEFVEQNEKSAKK